MDLRYVICDVFTDTPLAGNPLAVFTDGRDVETERMQQLARETNLSETVFVLPAEEGGNARIRIFTPAQEIPFAGHPTLGTAFVLAAPLQLTEIRLETGKGIVPVALEREGARIIFGWMTQPIPTFEPYADEQELLEALRVERSELPIEVYDNGIKHVYVTLGSEERSSGAPAGSRQAGRATGHRRGQLLRGLREAVEDANVLARGRGTGGSGDRICRRPARAAPRAPRPDLLRRRDRDHARGSRSADRPRSTPWSTGRPSRSSG